MPEDTKAPAYLGDAVYAKIENGVLAISLTDHRNEPVVYLEPEVMQKLIKYYQEDE